MFLANCGTEHFCCGKLRAFLKTVLTQFEAYAFPVEILPRQLSSRMVGWNSPEREVHCRSKPTSTQLIWIFGVLSKFV